MKRTWLTVGLAVLLAVAAGAARPSAQNRTIGVNVVLSTDVTPAVLTDLGRYGRVVGTIDDIRAVFLRARESQIPAIQALPYVAAANPDQARQGSTSAARRWPRRTSRASWR